MNINKIETKKYNYICIRFQKKPKYIDFLDHFEWVYDEELKIWIYFNKNLVNLQDFVAEYVYSNNCVAKSFNNRNLALLNLGNHDNELRSIAKEIIFNDNVLSYIEKTE